jgi:hypothetical protein
MVRTSNCGTYKLKIKEYVFDYNSMGPCNTLYYMFCLYSYGRHHVCHITKYFDERIAEIAIFSDK